jgi:hypothetical protein
MAFPLAIRSDNGPPFASKAVGGLSELSVWWIKLGIRVERIDHRHPEQNGRHERMHRTLKEETASPPQPSFSRQQREFQRFRRYFNEERPHEALGQQAPAVFYKPSPRPYPKEVPTPEYPNHHELRCVRPNGTIHWRGASIFVAKCLADESVGLCETTAGMWQAHFSNVPLGLIDQRRPTDKLIRPRTKKRPDELARHEAASERHGQ